MTPENIAAFCLKFLFCFVAAGLFVTIFWGALIGLSTYVWHRPIRDEDWVLFIFVVTFLDFFTIMTEGKKEIKR